MKDVCVLVIGLGSMGKRRVRNLQALGITNITGFDFREDRRKEASELYGIKVVDSFQKVLVVKQDVWIISTPPDVHHIYMKEAVIHKVPSFIEASVVNTDFETIIKDAAKYKVFLAPSCTLYFHPAIKAINEIIQSRILGNITNIIYHSGQYLPDWHTYEKVNEYYVSKKATGGAREIVPFELTWLTKIFGFPESVTGFFKKTIHIEGAEDIDDTYNLLLAYKSCILNLSVDVVSRYATRRLLINGELGQLHWNWDDYLIKLFTIEQNVWKYINYETMPAQTGYNKNITEQMYIDEMRSFLNAVLNGDDYPNSLEEDHQVLKLLFLAERSAQTNHTQFVK